MNKILTMMVLAFSLSSFAAEVETNCAAMNESRVAKKVIDLNATKLAKKPSSAVRQ